MRIRIADIPPEGRDLDFALKAEPLNERLAGGLVASEGRVTSPTVSIKGEPEVQVHLDLEGSTVLVRGLVTAQYSTECARCLEDTVTEVHVPLDLVLKPSKEPPAARAAAEDLNFGHYDNEEVDCTPFAQEFLILALPFTTVCSESCRGLCPTCGKNLNSGPCECSEERADSGGQKPFGILKDLLPQ